MTAPFVDRLTPVLVEGDLVGARVLLDELEGPAMAQAKTWFAGSRRWLAEVELSWAGDDWRERFDTRHRAMWILGMCAVRLCGPVTAARRVPWLSCWDHMENPGEAAFVQLLWDTDRAWVAEFVEAASRVRLGGQARNVNEQLARALRAAAVHHGLPCPTGPTFLARWWAGTGEHATLADRLAADPFMPDLLLLYLASGHCGDLPELPDAVAELVGRGVVEREAVLAHVLELLTAAQRPKSQRVLAKIARALDPTPREVPGGLDYLMGVLATSHGGVVPPLLPVALDLVADGDGLVQLTAVLAARPEKQPKSTLLDALPALAARAGTAAALDALALLGADDDAAFTARVDKVAAGLGGAARTRQAAAAATGLWERPPTPGDLDRYHPMDHVRVQADWRAVLDVRWRSGEEARAWVVDTTLAAMVDGTFDGQALRQAASATLADRHFAPRACALALDDLFLGGGLRQGWPVAVDIADLACGATSRPPGLADLLRTLAGYAVEVPRPWPNPPHVAALAAAPGGTKAQVEARRLVQVLAGDGAPGEPRATPPAAPARPTRRGLWDQSPPALQPLPSFRRLPESTNGVVDGAGGLLQLRSLLAEDDGGPPWGFEDISEPPPTRSRGVARRSLTAPDQVLAATVTAVHRYGAGAVRGQIAGAVRRYEPVDVVAAVDAWAIRTLDHAAFWRVAQGPVATPDELRQAWEARGLTPTELYERGQSLPPFAQRLAQPDHPDVAALVLPRELVPAPERLAFLRAAEGLLRAERQATLLSTPTWADGTLDLDDLLARLAAVGASQDPTVGPIDLVQALHRLRPTAPARAAEVPAGVRTDPAFTARDGSSTWDASELVRAWVAAGGLPPLDPVAGGDGTWSTQAVAPVPFQRLAALPRALADDPYMPGSMIPTLRMMPLWADRVVRTVAETRWDFSPGDFPGHAAGGLGLPLHDRLLAFLAPGCTKDAPRAVPALVDAAVRDRLVPATFVEAVLLRHRHDALFLRGLVQCLEHAFEVPGAIARLWPSVVAAAAALCSVPAAPAGLSELLRLLTAYAPEVPASAVPAVPESLLRLASGRGSTRKHHEARRLVIALEGVREGAP